MHAIIFEIRVAGLHQRLCPLHRKAQQGKTNAKPVQYEAAGRAENRHPLRRQPATGAPPFVLGAAQLTSRAPPASPLPTNAYGAGGERSDPAAAQPLRLTTKLAAPAPDNA
jgi:hypothetical protein